MANFKKQNEKAFKTTMSSVWSSDEIEIVWKRVNHTTVSQDIGCCKRPNTVVYFQSVTACRPGSVFTNHSLERSLFYSQDLFCI